MAILSNLNNYERELDRIKQHLHTARDAREYEHYVRQYDEMRNAAIRTSQNYGGAIQGQTVQGQMMQASMLNMAGVPKMPEPATPLSFLTNADKKLLLTGVLA